MSVAGMATEVGTLLVLHGSRIRTLRAAHSADDESLSTRPRGRRPPVAAFVTASHRAELADGVWSRMTTSLLLKDLLPAVPTGLLAPPNLRVALELTLRWRCVHFFAAYALTLRSGLTEQPVSQLLHQSPSLHLSTQDSVARSERVD